MAHSSETVSPYHPPRARWYSRFLFLALHAPSTGAGSHSPPPKTTIGSFVVPENHWFLWPELDISGHGNVGEAAISDTMMQLAMVPETDFVGKPFKRWFWREQILQ